MKKRIFHLVIWTVLILYLLLAKDLFVRFILKDNGKPVEGSLAASTEVKETFYDIETFTRARYDGEELFQVYGWAFNNDTFDLPLDLTSKQIVLQPDDGSALFFDLKRFPRSALNQSLAGRRPETDATYAGFLGYISEDAIQRGYYRVGFHFTGADGSVDYYFWTSEFLHKTANTLQLTDTIVKPEPLSGRIVLAVKRIGRRVIPSIFNRLK